MKMQASSDEDQVIVPRRVLRVGPYRFMEKKSDKKSWHVPGGNIMSTNEILEWAITHKIAREVKVVFEDFHYNRRYE
jgi:hypothetical protein